MRILSILTFLIFFSVLIPDVKGQRATGAEMTIKKELNGEDTLHVNREFPVDKDLVTLTIEITGKVSSGRINILMSTPEGRNIDYVIDKNSDGEFKQNINLRRNKEYCGTWKILVDAYNAIGSYSITLRTSSF